MKVNTRVVVTDNSLMKTVELVEKKLDKRIKQKGNLCHASTHESLGIITEEFWEYVEAVKDNDNEEIMHELVDIAVGCLYAVASMMEMEKLKLQD